MEWCVCKYKKTGELFITDRWYREKLLELLTRFRMDIPSLVVKTFDNYQDAWDYINDQKETDKLLNEIL